MSDRVRFRRCCEHCGNPLTPGGAAFVCSAKGGGRLPLPDYCADRECRTARDELAIQRAVEQGVITA